LYGAEISTVITVISVVSQDYILVIGNDFGVSQCACIVGGTFDVRLDEWYSIDIYPIIFDLDGFATLTNYSFDKDIAGIFPGLKYHHIFSFGWVYPIVEPID